MCAVFGCIVSSITATIVCNAQVSVVLWLFLLFRVLSSTAENFFSPILTQLSQEMGLPPRFAGGMPLLCNNTSMKYKGSTGQFRPVLPGHCMGTWLSVPPHWLSACRVAMRACLCSAFV